MQIPNLTPTVTEIIFLSFLKIFVHYFTSKVVFVFWFQVALQLDGGCGLTVQGHDDLQTSSIETD